MPDALPTRPPVIVHAVVASVPVGDCDPEVMALALCERRDARAKDATLAPPVEPIWGLDDTERRCGCDESYTCRAHEAGAL